MLTAVLHWLGHGYGYYRGSAVGGCHFPHCGGQALGTDRLREERSAGRQILPPRRLYARFRYRRERSDKQSDQYQRRTQSSTACILRYQHAHTSVNGPGCVKTHFVGDRLEIHFSSGTSGGRNQKSTRCVRLSTSVAHAARNNLLTLFSAPAFHTARVQS